MLRKLSDIVSIDFEGQTWDQRLVKFGKLAPKGQCSYCDNARLSDSDFFPSHTASPRCRSGKNEHCTCDTCF